MTAKVIDLHPTREPGYDGKVWDAERMHATGRWALVGRLPDRPNSFTDVLEVRFSSHRGDPGAIVRHLADYLNSGFGPIEIRQLKVPTETEES